MSLQSFQPGERQQQLGNIYILLAHVTQGTPSVRLDMYFRFIFICIFICEYLLSTAELKPLFDHMDPRN